MKIERSVLSLVDAGQYGLVATIECSHDNSLPNIVIMGYANKAVDDARERVAAACVPRSRRTDGSPTKHHIPNCEIEDLAQLTPTPKKTHWTRPSTGLDLVSVLTRAALRHPPTTPNPSELWLE